MESAKVRAFVIDVDGEGIRYAQDMVGVVKRGRWTVGRCYFGRPGRVDRDRHFQIVAVASLPDGRQVESAAILVLRE